MHTRKGFTRPTPCAPPPGLPATALAWVGEHTPNEHILDVLSDIGYPFTPQHTQYNDINTSNTLRTPTSAEAAINDTL